MLPSRYISQTLVLVEQQKVPDTLVQARYHGSIR